MKKLITRVLLLFFFATALPFAAASQNSNKSWTPEFVTLNSPGAGQLKLTKEALTASNLRITGDIDARDFKTLKEATISRTRVLDLSDANIKAYTGKEGCVTYKGSNWIVPAAKDYVYKANTFPINAFNERRDNSLNTWTAGSTSLRKVILPKTLEAFEPDAFYDNNNLTELVVPETSTKLKGEDGAIYSSDGRRLLVVAPGYTGHLDIPATVQSVDSCALAYARPASLRFHTVTPPDMLGKDLVNTAYIVCPSPANYSKLFPDIDCVSKISQIIVNDVKEGTLMETIGNLGYVRNDVRSVRVSGTINQEDCDALFSLKNLHHADLSGCTMTGNSIELPEGSLCEIQLPMAYYNSIALYISANNYLQGKLDISEDIYYVQCLNKRFSEIVFPSSLIYVDSFNDCIARRIDFSACNRLSEIDGFSNCANLEELILPPYLEKLNGFTYAPLTSIEIPSTVNYINTCGWDIRNIVLPESLEEIQEFSEMPYLEQVDASKCSNLSNVMYAFNDCPRLETLDLSNSPIDRFEKCCNDYRIACNRVATRQASAHPVSEFLGTCLIVLVLWFGGTLIFSDHSPIDAPTFIFYLVILYSVINPLKDFSKAGYSIPKGLASIERIDKILSAENPIKEPQTPQPIKDLETEIEFHDVSFQYTSAKQVLKHINLKIKKGQTIALVGQSGSGKSTLADLLPRYHDVTSGSITINGINIKDFSVHDLRSIIGNVNQEAILFNDSFFNNIAFGVENATMEQVIEAAKIANAHDFIMESENGYDTNIGDRGCRLSGGQRQRVSIARAILKNPPILILDEATSALDTESERLVQEALERLMKSRTTIAIAHRLSTIRHADEICVMHEGEIVERGTHEELLAKGGYYKKLNDMQQL